MTDQTTVEDTTSEANTLGTIATVAGAATIIVAGATAVRKVLQRRAAKKASSSTPADNVVPS